MPAIDVVRLDENPHESVYGIREDTSSRGVDLEGAVITATYADGTTETITWKALDPYTNGGATGENIDMSFGYDWHELSTTKILTSLEFDLQPASSVFDTTIATEEDPGGESTPGSLQGFPFEITPEYEDMPGELTATYSGIVNLADSDAVGDLFTTMVIDFSGLPEGGLLGDLRWNSDIDTMEQKGDLKPASVTCFTRGTLIATDQGDLPIEVLEPGCRVLTQDGNYQELILPVSRIVEKQDLCKNPKLYPVRITAGALGAGLPKRDLLVSRQHRMVAQSPLVRRMLGAAAVLIAAIRLTDMPGIYVDHKVERIEYFHLIFERHEVIYAEGAPAESFLLNADAERTLTHAQREEFASLFPGALKVRDRDIPVHEIPSHARQKKLIDRHLDRGERLLVL